MAVRVAGGWGGGLPETSLAKPVGTEFMPLGSPRWLVEGASSWGAL